MPLERPPLVTIRNRVIGDLSAAGGDPRLRRSNHAIIAAMVTGASHGLHGYIDSAARQAIPDTAEDEWIDRWAAIWGVLREAPSVATGTVSLSGTVGTSLPAGSSFVRSDSVRYETVSEATIPPEGSIDVDISALVPSDDGNALDGAALTLESPPTGIDPSALAASLTGGADAEKDSSLRSRLLSRIQTPPHGGARNDYKNWMLDRGAHGVAVTRVFVSPGEMGYGTVTVRVMMDDSYADGLPQPADLEILQDYLDSVRPVTAQAFVVPPIAQPISFQVAISPFDAGVIERLETALRLLIRQDVEPGGGLLISRGREAASTTIGEADHRFITPEENVVALSFGHIVTFGSLTVEGL